MLARMPVRRAVPSFHRMDGDPVADFDSAVRERPPQRRIGTADQLGIARNGQSEREEMLLKSLDISYCPHPQYREPTHTRFFPFAPPQSQQHAEMLCQYYETVLTNDGMLKILCLDVEILLGNIYSNSLDHRFANCKGEVHVTYAT